MLWKEENVLQGREGLGLQGRQRGQPGSYVIRETFRQGYYLHNLRDTFISEKRTFQAEGKVRGDGTVFF